MSTHKVELSALGWESPMAGVRHKFDVAFGRKLRLVEYSRDMPIHWCDRGHFGYIQEGRMQIEFETETCNYEQGDCVCIPDGAEHKHRAKVLSDVVKVFFLEDA